MTALITSVEHALAAAARDTVNIAKFVETSVLPALKTAQANSSTIEAVTGLISPQAANIERADSQSLVLLSTPPMLPALRLVPTV